MTLAFCQTLPPQNDIEPLFGGLEEEGKVERNFLPVPAVPGASREPLPTPDLNLPTFDAVPNSQSKYFKQFIFHSKLFCVNKTYTTTLLMR